MAGKSGTPKTDVSKSKVTKAGKPKTATAKAAAPKVEKRQAATAKAATAKPAAPKTAAPKTAASKAAKPVKATAQGKPAALSPQAQALLEAQTRFWMEQMTSRQIERLIKDEWSSIYDAMGSITLRDAFEESKVKGIAHRYALEMDVSGAILELAGEIASLVFLSPQNRKTKLSDVITDRTFDELLEKTFETGGLLDRSTARMRESQAFRELLSDLVVTVLKGSLTSDASWLGRGGVKRGARVLKDWIGERAPDLTESLEESARRWVDGGVASTVDLVISLLEHDRYRDTAMAGVSQWWDRVKGQPVSSVRAYISDNDLQEYIVVGYEFWLEFRQSAYLKSFIDGGIALFYRKYGDDTLSEVVAEMGLDEATLKTSVLDYAGDIASIAVKTGFAEGFVRRQLTHFYQGKEASAILDGKA